MKILLYAFAFCVLFSSCERQKSYYVVAKDPAWLAIHDTPILGPLNTFLTALMLEIAKKEKFKVNLVDISEFELYQGLEGEDFQAIFSTLSPDDTTAELYDFSLPILAIGPVLIVRNDDPAVQLDDLKGKILGVPVYGASIYLAQKVPNVVIKEYVKLPQALEDLQQEKIDGVLMGTLLASSLVNKYQGLKIATPPLTNEAIRLLVLKGKNQKLLQEVNQNLERLSKESNLQKLQQKFYLSLRQLSETQRVILNIIPRPCIMSTI